MSHDYWWGKGRRMSHDYWWGKGRRRLADVLAERRAKMPHATHTMYLRCRCDDCRAAARVPRGASRRGRKL